MARPDPTTIQPDALGHRSRYSDSSLYDEVCVLCGANDSPGGNLGKVCTNAMEGDLPTVTIQISEIVTREVVMPARDVEAFRQAWDKAEALFANTRPPLLPSTARVIHTTTEAHRPVKNIACHP